MDASRQCQAKSKRTGQQCKRVAVPGKRVCYYHGGASTGPKTAEGRKRCALAALVHGAYVERVLTEEEQQLYDAFVDQIRQDFTLNRSSDEVAVQMAAMSFVQFCRAHKAGKEAAAETLDRMVRSHLKDLKATKLSREGESVSLSTTPAEWAAALLDKVRKADQNSKAKPRKGHGDRRTRKEPRI